MEKNASTKKTAPQCSRCKHLCCSYITVKIDAPRTILDFDGLLWQLSHENIEVYSDNTGWHLIIYNKCLNLKKNGECGVYESRPITCREYSRKNCDYHGHISQSSLQYFANPQALDEYCSKRFKTWKTRFNK